MARPYYIFSSGILRRKDNTLYFEPFDSKQDVMDDDILCLAGYPELENEVDGCDIKRKPIPVEDVDSIYIFGDMTFNTRFLNFLNQNNIVLHVFNYYGFYSGSFYPREFLNSGRLIVKQVENYIFDDLRIFLARKFVEGASYNMLRNLKSYTFSEGLNIYIEAIESERTKIESCMNIHDLMACEGHIRNAYYKAWDFIIDDEFFGFDRRTKQPPENAINALISFGNSMLYTTVLSEIYKTQLNPTISYLHEPSDRRFSLALDIAEIFKPVIVDRLIFKIINRGQISKEHFISELNFCYLSEDGRKLFVKEFDELMRSSIRHKKLNRNVSYRGLIRLECYKLIKHLFGDEVYNPLKVWWY
ncbi:CRISPR-associated protein, Cas1 family [Candidatus Kryptobacter tengchongensis]|nr:CRISPR-associated protein, Cas1 family [Candidatus Kryptobacter tengchongensis]